MSEFDFKPYLSAIATYYSQDGSFYMPTDAILLLEFCSMLQQEQEWEEKRSEPLPVLEGLRMYGIGNNREHLLLAGRPGSGKSTALRQLAVELAEAALPCFAAEDEEKEKEKEKDLSSLEVGGENKIPVLIHLRESTPVVEAIANELERGNLELGPQEIERLLCRQLLILLFDGVNEIPNDQLLQQLQIFRGTYPKTPMIFATRDLATGNSLGISRKLEIQSLSLEQLRDFVEAYLGEKSGRLLGQLCNLSQEIAETPLLLKIMCDVFQHTEKIPLNKGELFRLFDANCEQIKKEIEYVPASENFWALKSEVLQHLAFSMIQADTNRPTELWLTISKQQAENFLEEWLYQQKVVDESAKAKAWLQDLCKYYLLQETEKPGGIEFPHQLFQEYYAAEKLLKMIFARHSDTMQPERFKHFYLNYLKWTGSLAIVFSLMGDEAIVVDLINQALAVDWMLGAQLVGEVRTQLQGEAIELIDTLEVPVWLRIEMWRATRSDAIENRMAGYLRQRDNTWCHLDAAEVLANIDSPIALEALILEFKRNYSDALSRRYNCATFLAALLLRKIHKEECIREMFINTLSIRDGDENNNSTLGPIKEVISRELIPFMLEQFDDENSTIRNNAKLNLKKIPVEYIIPGLVVSLNHKSHNVRWRASNALKGIGEENVFSILDSYSGMHFASISQLITIFPAWFCKNDGLIALMLEKTQTAAYKPSQAIQINVSGQFIRLLLDEVKNNANAEQSIHVYEEICSENILPILLDSLNNSIIHRGQIYIIQALGLLGNKEAIPELINFLKEENKDIQFHAAEALGRLGDEAGISILMQALEHAHTDRKPYVEVVDYARRASHILGILKSKSAISRLINLLDNPDASVRRSAILSL
jgi:HEAT repeat protein/DNA polymerase III delta prime subunit